MKKISFAYILCFLMVGFGGIKASACVNLDINVGAVESFEGRLFAEVVSTFIHERTGTKSIIKFYDTLEALNEAVVEKEIELMVLSIDGLAAYPDLKEEYKKRNLILLAPMVQVEEGAQQNVVSPVLAQIVLEKFPALPRLLKKLAGKIDVTTKNHLIKLIGEKDEKPSRVAKDFLVSNRLI